MASTALLQDDILEIRPSLKAFGLAELLSLSSGLRLSPPAALHGLIAFVTETLPADAAARAADAKTLVEAQLPFLKTVDYAPLHKTFRQLDSLALWLDAQIHRYGEAHNVIAAGRWARRRNSHRL